MMNNNNLLISQINSNKINPNKNKDLLSEHVLNNTASASYNALFESPIHFTGHTGLGESMFDKDVPFSALGELNEIRAQRQPWIAKAGAGVARVGTKALTEIAKIPGVAGGILAGGVGQISDGISGEDNTDFMKVAFDNAWINAINNFNEYINTEALPVYVKKSVSEGNLWDNITSIDFWATDGADGLGYIAAMLAPGAILNSLKFGSGVVSATGKLGKAAKINKLLGSTDDLASFAAKAAKRGLPTDAKNIDLYAQTVANTILEAGAEAQQGMQEYEDSLTAQLKNGEITQQEFDEKIKFRSNIGANIFGANAAILIGPNAIMSKLLWGGAKTGARTGTKVVDGVIQHEAKKSTLKNISDWGNRFVAGAASEGLWEEGMQSTASNYFGDNPDKNLLDFGGTFAAEYLDMLGTTEGLKAIFLGAAFGGGMSSVQSFSRNSKARDRHNKLIDYANSNISDFLNDFSTSDVINRNEDGSIARKNGEVDYDTVQLDAKLNSLNVMEQLSGQYDQAMIEGNTEKAAQIRDIAMTKFVKDFVGDGRLGTETLRDALNSHPGVEELAKSENITKEEVINDIMEKADALNLAMSTFSDFAKPLINIKHDNATKEEIDAYYEGLKLDYYNIKASKDFVNKRVKKHNDALNKALEDKGYTREEYDSNGRLARDLAKDDVRIQTAQENLNNYKTSQEQIKKAEDKFWNAKENQKNFNERYEHNQKLKEEAAKEAETNAAQEAIDKIEAAVTEKEIDDALSESGKIELEGETAILDEIKNEIEANPTIATLEKAMERLANTNFQQYAVADIARDIYDRIEKIQEAKKIFKDNLEKGILDREILIEDVNNEISNIISEIEELTRKHEKTVKSLNQAIEDTKKDMRNRALIKSLIKDTENALAEIERTIKALEKGKKDLYDQLKVINQEISFIQGRLQQVDQQEFTSVGHIIQYIEDNVDKFKDHRLDISRLLVQQYYTQENVNALEEAISVLERHREFFHNILKNYKSLPNNEETRYYREAMLATSKELYYKKKELKEEKAKLERLNKAVSDKQALKTLEKEDRFWRSLVNNYKPKTNPYVMMKAITKREQLRNEARKRKEEAIAKEKENSEIKKQEKAKREAEKDDLGNWIIDKFNVGEDFPLTNAQVKRFIKSADKPLYTGAILKENDISLTNVKVHIKELNATITIPLIAEKNQDSNFDMDYSTEGSVNHDLLIPEDSDTNTPITNDDIEKNGSKIVSTDPEGIPLKWIKEQFPGIIEYETNPIDKVGTVVHFEVNEGFIPGVPQEQMSEVIKEIKSNKDFIKLNEDETKYVNSKTGKEYSRVTKFIGTSEEDVETKPGSKLESSQILGNKVDTLVRDFFDDNIQSLESYELGDTKMVTEFIEHLKTIKDAMDKRGETVLANDIVLYNDDIGVAGTVDLLTYDKDGQFRIYDMKSMAGNQFKTNHRSGSNKGKSKYYHPYNIGEDSNAVKHQKQLSLYRILLNNTHGIKAKTIGVLPIELDYKAGDKTTKKLNKLPGLTLKKLDYVAGARLDASATRIIPKPHNNKKFNNAIKDYMKLLSGAKLNDTEIEFLIDYLPLVAVLDKNKAYKSPILNYPNTDNKRSLHIYKNTSRKLRENIINRLIAGEDINTITTTIEGQFGGVLRVAPKVNDNVVENNIFDLYHFDNMSDKEKLDYINDNLAIVNQMHAFEYINGKTEDFVKANGTIKHQGKGELYLMIPKANGEKFPLKLNIKKLKSNAKHLDLVSKLYELLVTNEDVNNITTINEIKDVEFREQFKTEFKTERDLIGKAWDDITIKELLNLFVWDGTTSLKSRVGYVLEDQPNTFVYGDPKMDGKVINDPSQFDIEHFKKWLANNKRYNIRFRKRKTDTMNTAINTTPKYLKYLLDNKILNTNAIVGEPTFQGYTSMYLDSSMGTKPKVKYTKKAAKPSNQSTSSNADLGYESSTPLSAFGLEDTSSSQYMEGEESNLPLSAFGIEDNSSEKVENNPDNTRNSPENVVSLENIPNTMENKAMNKAKEQGQKTDVIEATDENVNELKKELKDLGLWRRGSDIYNKVMSQETNQDRYNVMQDIISNHKENIKNLKKDCKHGV